MSVIAGFIFAAVACAVVGIPTQAHAYAIGTVPPPTTSGSTGSSYDFNGSLQNLVSPFTSFINSLKLNNNTTMGPAGNITWPPTAPTMPIFKNGVQSTISQWLTEFNNWFYGVTGVQLSGIIVVLLNLISWALGLAQQAVNWLLGLFH